MATDNNVDGFGSEHEVEDDNHVSALCGSTWYPDIFQKVEALLKDHEVPSDSRVALAAKVEYQLISDCIQLLVNIENGVHILYAFIRDKCGQKFPEVESLVEHPIDYVRFVKKAGFAVVDEACDQVFDLVSMRKRILDFVDSRMVYLAPNLSAVVGTTVAAKLMATAGGLESLGKMMACNIQLLGSQRRSLDGISTQLNIGYIQESEILQNFPSALTTGASRVLAASCSTAARIDFMAKDPTGDTGKRLGEVVVNKYKRYCAAKHTNISTALPSKARNNKVERRQRNSNARCASTGKRNLTHFGVLREISPDSRINTAEVAPNSEALVELSKSVSSWQLQVTNESGQGYARNLSGPRQIGNPVELRTNTAEASTYSKALVGVSERGFHARSFSFEKQLNKDM